ncbi:response regulator [Chitinophagaceae bacterium LB-8]|uniref:Response regulator n=1 Tax=Paraflavisolibacter caeni TaxID=2982496 RepID=A0A9X2XNL4_9BACT|nr:response regulator [Paraflavisolibacter caeni]MCU7549058.1 response regulator [Paraflavisolibacter caeni]
MILTNNKSNFIFLAEDDIDDQELLIEALTSLDDTIEVHVVNNGKKAVSYLEELPDNKKPCLIVLDYNLPEMNGADILNRINTIEKLHPVTKVIWSTSNSPVYEKICTELGAKAYFVKPTDFYGIEKIARIMLQLCGLKKE